MEMMMSSTSLHASLSQLAHFCAGLRLDLAQEKRSQVELEQALVQEGLRFERERPLCSRDIPDFIVHLNGYVIVLELKTRAQRTAIYKQLERYAAHDEVHALLLLTGTAMGLPEVIQGKPADVVSLGGGWL